ncbi:hypothetical protein GCM10028819_41030 [Spirosoma humi]
MKTPFFIYFILIGLTILVSCSKKNDDPQGSGSPGSGTIKLSQNGQVITQFETTNTVGVGGNGYEVVITSPDNKHSLVLSLQGNTAGTYPFITGSQPLTSGKANFMYQSDALPPIYAGTDGLLRPSAGEAVVKTITQTRCSGTFSATGKNEQDGKIYTLEGTFDAAIF